MRNIKSYILGLTASLAIGGLTTGCQNDFDSYVPQEPVASIKPNMTIFDLKKMYWDDDPNYIDTIGIDSVTHLLDDKDYIIAGRVISSDEAGNVFKSLVIQDETAALAMSINSYNLYLKYRVGQEIVINLKGMYIGKYNGLQQLGMPEWYESGSVWEASFMAPEFFQAHVELNGFPNAADVDTLEINSFDQLPSNPDGLCRYQSQLVKFNNVYFQNGGKEQFSEYHSSGVNQNIVDVNGSTLPVRTSGYSNFWNNMLPEGNCDVVCILSYYGNTGWQLILNDYQGIINVGNPTIGPGSEDNPYNVTEAIEDIKAGRSVTGWVDGYIVGAVAPEVSEVTSNEDIEWSDEVVLDNTLVIGATPDTKDISEALIIELPVGSALRQYGNLADNPSNYKKKIAVRGLFGKYMDTYGILDNTGKADQFKIEGVTIETGGASAGVGTEDSPYNVTQVIAMNPQGNADSPDETNVWVTGYIVGWGNMSTVFYINDETATFSVPATMATNILLALTPDVTDYKECIAIQLPSGNVRSALNLMDNPGNLGREVKICGNIAKYSGVPGLRSASNYVWLSEAGSDTPSEPDTPDTPVTPDGGTEDSPYNVNQVIAMNPQGNGDNPDMTDVWVAGYIVGWGNMTSIFYINEETATFSVPATMATNILLAATANVTDYKECIAIQLPSGNVRSALNLMDNPGNLGREVKIYGNIAKYSGIPGLRSASNYVWLSVAGGGDSPSEPDTPVTPPVTSGNTADFNTFNDGKAVSSYSTYTSADGWTTEYCMLLQGGLSDTSFMSTDTNALIPVVDGTIPRPGKITSPTISGGLNTLSFKYGFPYTETSVGFTVYIKQNGSVVASDKVLIDPATKGTSYDYTHEFNVSGDFVIEIVNDIVTQATTNNGSRVAICDLSWTN